MSVDLLTKQRFYSSDTVSKLLEAVRKSSLVLAFFVLVFLMLCTTSRQAFAVDIYDLQRSNDIEIIAWVGEQEKENTTAREDVQLGSESDSNKPVLINNESYSVNEQVVLTVEVATPRWLTGGTRIGSIEIPNVIAKQRNQLATNYTEKKNGQTWSRQRWEVTLYPLTSGTFVIPPTPVKVQVSAPDGSNVSGTLYTKPITFEARLPSGLLSHDIPWFSATDVEVSQEWQQSGEHLKVGDALTRKVTLKAKDSISVLLPDLADKVSAQQYQSYPKPNILDDTQERGDYRTSRTEEVVYVIQEGGELVFPDYQFQWWNSETKTLEKVVVKGQSFVAEHTFKSAIQLHLGVIASVALGVLLSVLLAVGTRRYYRNRPTPQWLVFHRLLKTGDWPKLRTAIYQQLRAKSSSLELAPFSDEQQWQSDSQNLQRGIRDKTVFKRLWFTIRKKRVSRSYLSLPKALPILETDPIFSKVETKVPKSSKA